MAMLETAGCRAHRHRANRDREGSSKRAGHSPASEQRRWKTYSEACGPTWSPSFSRRRQNAGTLFSVARELEARMHMKKCADIVALSVEATVGLSGSSSQTSSRLIALPSRSASSRRAPTCPIAPAAGTARVHDFRSMNHDWRIRPTRTMRTNLRWLRKMTPG